MSVMNDPQDQTRPGDKITPGIFRLAMRVEGDNWNAYAALLGTMDGAVLLGSIKMACVAKRQRKDAFMGLMKDVLGDFVRDTLGGSVEKWNEPERAPEHERSGRA